MYGQARMYRVFRLINLLKRPPGKTLAQLASHLETSERTVRRYLELLEDVGFIIEKHFQYNSFFIPDFTVDEEAFTVEESSVLAQMVKSSGDDTFKESLLKKLYRKSELEPLSASLTKGHLSKVVEQINLAMAEKKQIVFKKYSSLNSSSVKDRIVEPIGFTEDFKQIDVFDVENEEVRTYKTERISDVEISEDKFAFEKSHKKLQRDIFGSVGSTEFMIHINLNFRSFTLLKEEFPQTKDFVKEIAGDYPFMLKIQVRHLDAIARFTMGLIDQIEVKGGSEFIDFLTNRMKSFLNKTS